MWGCQASCLPNRATGEEGAEAAALGLTPCSDLVSFSVKGAQQLTCEEQSAGHHLCLFLSLKALGGGHRHHDVYNWGD